MKKLTKNILLILGSAALVVGTGIGTYYIVQKLLKTNLSTISDEEIKSNSKRIEPIQLKRNFKEPRNNNEVVYVDLIEYKYNGKYFLGLEGLKKLNKKINDFLPFSSEIEQLKSISINDVLSLPKDINSINGQYDTFTMELDIDVRRNINSNNNLDQKVDQVFATILHEYGHHLANTYITSNQYEDNLKYNARDILVPTNRNGLFLYKNLPKTFFEKWMSALNYDDEFYQLLEQNQLDKNIYKDISSKALFEAANFGPSNLWDDLSQNQNEYKVHAKVNLGTGQLFNLQYSINPSNLVNYTYGVDELFTRHLVSFNYLSNNDYNYLFYKGADGRDYLNSFAPDVFQRNNLINRNIYSVDNIFGGILLQQNGGQIQQIESKAEQIVNAYKGVFGYGKLISQIYMDNSNNKHIQKEGDEQTLIRSKIKSEDFSKIKIGGYIPKNKNIKALVLNFVDGTTKQIPIYKISSKSLKAKTSVLSKTYQSNPDDDKYDSYISEQIDFNQINSEQLESISYWEDLNSNNIYETSENKFITRDDIVLERNISTFREAFKRQTNDKRFYVYSDTHKAKIFSLHKDEQTNKVSFRWKWI